MSPSATGWYVVNVQWAFDPWALGPFSSKRSAVEARREECRVRNLETGALRIVYLVETKVVEGKP